MTVWLDRRHTDDEASLAALVEILGIPADCVRDITWSPHPVVQRELDSPPPSDDGPEPTCRTRFFPERR
ncbi:hypothetical protein ACFVJM_30365 [Streptomyces virginiae]|uniref:hypothetical protein n=1 Tax=Streptomyces virginiae TaxID=1961 RepID=UPI00363C935E